MSVSIEPMSLLAGRARHALVEELGAVDAVRFLNEFRQGSGDYTVEREAMFTGESVKGIIVEIKAKRRDEG